MLASDAQGNHHFYLSPNEVARIFLTEDTCFFNVNMGTTYWLPRADVKQIVVEGAEQVQFTPAAHSEKLQQYIRNLEIDKGICVDIGAYDGVSHSNTFPLIHAGWSGLQLECERNRFASLAHTYRAFPQVDLARVKVTPQNVCAILHGYGIPHAFDFLSLDIDSYDYFVLEALLKEFRPTLIMTEINEVIPPPIKFAAKYHPDLRFDAKYRFYGQSLAQLQELCQKENYVILDMHYMDVFLIDARYTDGESSSLSEIYQKGLQNQPFPDYYADYPFDVKALWAATPEAAVAMIQKGYQAFAGQFICDV